jgi:hypothetical protein
LISNKRRRLSRNVPRESGGIALLISNLGARRWCVVSATPRAHYSQDGARYLLYRRLDGSRKSCRLPPPGFEPRTFQLATSRCTDYAVRLINNTVGNISLFGRILYFLCLIYGRNSTSLKFRKVIIKISYLKAYDKFIYRTDIDAYSAIKRQAMYI